MRTLSLLCLIVATIVLATFFATAQSSSTDLIKLWESRLPSSTALDVHLSVWIDPQSAVFSFENNDLIAVTTVDGALTMMNATSGASIWSLSSFPSGTPAQWQSRSCGGNANGLFIYQSGMIMAIHPLTSKTLWAVPTAPFGFNSGSTQLYLYNDALIMNDANSIASVSALTGRLNWSKMNQCVGGCSYRIDTISNSGRVAFFEKSETESGAYKVVVYDKTGTLKLQKNFAASMTQTLFLASVDSFTVTVFNLNNPIIGYRYPLLAFTNFTDANNGESITGYSLSCPWGGENCQGGPGSNPPASYDNKNGFTTLFVNTNYRTYSFNYSDGSVIGASPLHQGEHGHLVAMAQQASLTSQTGSNAQLHAYKWDTMNHIYTATLPTVEAYNIRVNWYNEIFAPASTGFYFLFGTSGVVNSTFSSAYPDGIVKHNIVINRDRFYFSSGNTVAAYAFPPSTFN